LNPADSADLITKISTSYIFTGEITDRGFGLTTVLRVPGAGEIMIYQPHHPTVHDL
jgi:hypothetical protein